MTTRVILGLLASFCVESVSAFPAELHGTWEDARMGDVGVVTVSIRPIDERTVSGVIHLRGSKDCTLPVVFRGTMVSQKKVEIESTEEVVCGYKGKLFGVVTEEDGGVYRGSYRYVLFIPLGEGTFLLKPPTSK